MRSKAWMWVAIALGVVAVVTVPLLFFALGRDSSSDRSEPSRTTTTTTIAPQTTPTTVGPQTVPVPPVPPVPPTTGAPPAVTVPPGRAPRTTTTTTTSPATPTTTPETTSRTTPGSTTDPTVTAAPGSTTTRPSTSTTKPKPPTRKTVVYSPPGARKRQGDLVLPRQHGDTIVVLVHGGDGSTGTRKQMRGWANFYAQDGYPSFAIDYLLAKPGTPPPVYPKPETDVKAAVQYLRGRATELGLDADRIVVQGFDAGAALGAQALVTPDDPFFDGPGRYPGVSDKPAAFVGFYGRYDGGGQPQPTTYYGGPPDSSDPKVQERYAKANSIAHAADAADPALLLQGDSDRAELVASATAFRDALQGTGKDVTLTLVPGAGPAFDQEKSGALTPAGKQAAQQVVDSLAARFPPS